MRKYTVELINKQGCVFNSDIFNSIADCKKFGSFMNCKVLIFDDKKNIVKTYKSRKF